MITRTEERLRGGHGLMLGATRYGDADLPPVVFLHGAGQTRHAWAETAGTIAELGWQAICVDHRGHGDSDWPDRPDYDFDHYADDIDGIPAWHAILEPKLDGQISALEAREEYVNLMRWRLEKILGYRWTHQLLVNNESNRPLYFMVFATDSEPGKKIMRDLYEKAAVTFPKMIEQNRALHERIQRESQGVMDLFSSAGIDVPTAEPPGSGRIRLPNDPPEQPREHDPDRCRFCATDAPWDDSTGPDEGWEEEYLLDEEF